MPAILGLSAFYHDSAAALVVNGRIVAAAQEERFTRQKHDDAFPRQAVDYCLQTAGLTAADLTYVAFYDKPLLKFDRLLETYLAFAPRGFRSFFQAMPQWLQGKLNLRRTLRKELGIGKQPPILFLEHHESHAASAFFPSPFEEAAILTFDGVGEWATASMGVGRGSEIRLDPRATLPAFAGAALLRLHLLLRLQGQQRRVQADGPRPLRRAAVRQLDSRAPRRDSSGRFAPPGSVVLQLLP